MRPRFAGQLQRFVRSARGKTDE